MITKKRLWFTMIKLMKNIIHSSLVFKVINLLIEELKVELLQGKEIIIPNFGKFKLQNRRKRKHYDIKTNTVIESAGNNRLKFSMSRKLKKYMKSNNIHEEPK